MMLRIPTFISTLVVPTTGSKRVNHSVCRTRHFAYRCARRRGCPTLSAGVVRVGDVVAVERGQGIVEVARVTGVDSSGSTVDIIPLEPFVSELYVEGKSAPTYEYTKNVRKIVSEYVPSQNGWIVLDADLSTVRNEFATARLEHKEETVDVLEAPRRELPPEALLPQPFPKPTRTQAFIGAALTVPVASLAYTSFAGARSAYLANPVPEDFATSAAFRQVVLFLSASATIGSLLVGGALLFYALTEAAPDESES